MTRQGLIALSIILKKGRRRIEIVTQDSLDHGWSSFPRTSHIQWCLLSTPWTIILSRL